MRKIIEYINDARFAGRFIAALAILIYANTVPNKWAVDDGVVIHQNRFVQKGISGIAQIFSHDYMYGSTGQISDAVSGGRYRPLAPAIYAGFSEILAKPKTNHSINSNAEEKSGRVLNDLSENTTFPNLMHILNVLLYSLLCFVLYRFLLTIFEQQKQRMLLAFLTALLFTVHPLHTEAVANVKGSDEILCLLFSLLSVTALFRAYAGSLNTKIKQMLLGLAFFFLALLAKENATMFIFITPLTLWFFGKLKLRSVLSAGILLLIPTILYLGLRQHALGSIKLTHSPGIEMMNDPFLEVSKKAKFSPLIAGSDVQVLQNPSQQSINEMPRANQFATNIFTYGKYARLLAVPYPLTIDYYPRYIRVKSFSNAEVIISLIICLLVIGIALFGVKKKKPYSYGLLFFLISFFPVSNLLFPIGVNMAERFMFMPSLGMFITFSSLLLYIAERISYRVVFLTTALLSLFYISVAVKRNFDWYDNFKLISHDLKISTGSAKIKSDYGEIVLRKINDEHINAAGETHYLTNDEKAAQIQLLKTTLPQFKEALDVFPMYGLVWMNLARTNQYLGDLEDIEPQKSLNYYQTALAAYRQTDMYRPRLYAAQLRENKSICYASLGKVYGQRLKNIDMAILNFREAIRTDTANSYAYFLSGTAYDLKGDADSALYFAKKSFVLDSANRDYSENYGLLVQKRAIAHHNDKLELMEAEKILLHTIESNKLLPVDYPNRKSISITTLTALYNNYVLQENFGKMNSVFEKIQKLKQ